MLHALNVDLLEAGQRDLCNFQRWGISGSEYVFHRLHISCKMYMNVGSCLSRIQYPMQMRVIYAAHKLVPMQKSYSGTVGCASCLDLL